MNKEKKDLIEKILHEIAEDVIVRFDKKELKDDIGLLTGKAGISLFMFYNARYFKNDRYEEYALQLLEDVFIDINRGNLIPTYCSGLAGVCWTVIHLVDEGFIEMENLKVLDNFDDYLCNIMAVYSEGNNYDFLHGASGIALYFTKRAEKNKNVISYLTNYVQKLKDYAIFDDEKKIAKMISTVLGENDKPKQVYNLSMSHGMSSIIIILCKIHDLIEDKSDCLKLIEGMTNYLLSCEKPLNPTTYSMYPPSVEVDGNKSDSYGRLAWCYGDLNQGYAYLKARTIINDGNLRNKAKEIFLHMQNRKVVAVQSIRDAGLCHGASGIALICTNIKTTFEGDLFSELEKHWINSTMEFYHKDNGLEGFKMANKDGYEYESCLLSGTVGIGLYFLQICDKELKVLEEILLLN